MPAVPTISKAFSSAVDRGFQTYKSFGFAMWDKAIQNGDWQAIFSDAARCLPLEKQRRFFEEVFLPIHPGGKRLVDYCLAISKSMTPPFPPLLPLAEIGTMVREYLTGLGFTDFVLHFTDSSKEGELALAEDKDFGEQWALAWSKTSISAATGGYLDVWTTVKQLFEAMYGNILVGNDALAKRLVGVIKSNTTLAALSLLEESEANSYPLARIADLYTQGAYPLGFRKQEMWMFCSNLDER